ncbi:GtrA family protein [Clostridium scatologenes]|uniref:GtrA family protein n=1 Tax=Clostridium scatologenes TaxID=1548 RepID=A0A0E3M7T9_CLOSL|nr:GtrA family protein [Clostridium scatologenes]AKA70759.1 GtrA family protein [Clostridium scatologenes]
MKLVANITNYVFDGKFKCLSRFSLVGISNTIIDFIIFTIFQGLIGVNYTISQVLGYSFGVVNSFIFNKKWTFQGGKSNKKIYNELFQFIIVNIISLAITVIFMKLLVKDFRLNVYLAKILVTFIAQITNFIAYKLWIFN